LKCVCGYKKNYYWDDEYDSDNDKNSENFERIKGSFVVDRDNGYNSCITEVGLYSCPKCGTVRMEKL